MKIIETLFGGIDPSDYRSTFSDGTSVSGAFNGDGYYAITVISGENDRNWQFARNPADIRPEFAGYVTAAIAAWDEEFKTLSQSTQKHLLNGTTSLLSIRLASMV